MYTGLHVKYPLFLSDFNETWSFLTDFIKILKFQILWTSIQWELKSWTIPCGEMDRHDEAKSHFLQFVNMPTMFFLNITQEISLILKISHMTSKKLILQKCKLICFSQMMHHKYMKLPIWQNFITYIEKLLFQDSVMPGYESHTVFGC
jgi:hypothetical protein